MAGNLTSDEFQVADGFHGAIQAVFTTTGGVAGTFKLQGSVDKTTYTDITGSSNTIAAAGNILWNIYDIGYPWIRLVWTAGVVVDGSLTVKAVVKVRGD